MNEEMVETRILYTGDFRYENMELDSLSALHDSSGTKLSLNEMYLDTTFCSSSYQSFAPRSAAIRRIWDIVQDWVRKNGLYKRKRHKHVVLFHLPAQLGSEAILRHIYEQSNNKWKIHIGHQKFEEYLCTDDLGNCTASDPNEAQWIHACSWRTEKKFRTQANQREIPCQDGPFEVLHIRPSAMHFKTDKETKDDVIQRVGGDSYRVCYSCHSSLNELKAFVEYFQPKKIFPCVIPKGMTARKVLSLLIPVMENKMELPEEEVTISPVHSPIAGQQVLSPKGSPKDAQLDFLEEFTSPSKKRKAPVEEAPAPTLAKHPRLGSRKITFDQSGRASSGEEEDGSSETARSKRKFFQRSRKDKGAYSMPVNPEWPSEFDEVVGPQNRQNRRASLPHNLKIPHITITPSSPSPDPNHPDYPEFFEDKLYLESYKNKSTTSDSEGSNPAPDYKINDEDSTPELDVVLAASKNATERRNCLNFAKGLARKT